MVLLENTGRDREVPVYGGYAPGEQAGVGRDHDTARIARPFPHDFRAPAFFESDHKPLVCPTN